MTLNNDLCVYAIWCHFPLLINPLNKHCYSKKRMMGSCLDFFIFHITTEKADQVLKWLSHSVLHLCSDDRICMAVVTVLQTIATIYSPKGEMYTCDRRCSKNIGFLLFRLCSGGWLRMTYLLNQWTSVSYWFTLVCSLEILLVAPPFPRVICMRVLFLFIKNTLNTLQPIVNVYYSGYSFGRQGIYNHDKGLLWITLEFLSTCSSLYMSWFMWYKRKCRDGNVKYLKIRRFCFFFRRMQ